MEIPTARNDITLWFAEPGVWANGRAAADARDAIEAVCEQMRKRGHEVLAVLNNRAHYVHDDERRRATPTYQPTLKFLTRVNNTFVAWLGYMEWVLGRGEDHWHVLVPYATTLSSLDAFFAMNSVSSFYAGVEETTRFWSDRPTLCVGKIRYMITDDVDEVRVAREFEEEYLRAAAASI